MLAEIGAESSTTSSATQCPFRFASQDDLLLDALIEPEAGRSLPDSPKPIKALLSMIGLGYYDTYTPAVIRRNVLENPARVYGLYALPTGDLPGRLEVMLTYQTMVSDLTGLDIANASLLDEGTAASRR